MHPVPRLLAFLPLFLGLGTFATAAEPAPVYLDPAQPQPARIDDLVASLTLKEKTSLMANTTSSIPRYNWWSEALNGIPCSIHPLLYQLLGRWGFDGHVPSDCGSSADIRQQATVTL